MTPHDYDMIVMFLFGMKVGIGITVLVWLNVVPLFSDSTHKRKNDERP